jgi:hypothetical protein
VTYTVAKPVAIFARFSSRLISSSAAAYCSLGENWFNQYKLSALLQMTLFSIQLLCATNFNVVMHSVETEAGFFHRKQYFGCDGLRIVLCVVQSTLLAMDGASHVDNPPSCCSSSCLC